MEHYELLYNLEKPNKFGKDTVGSLSSRHTLNLYYVLDGHSKHPNSSILVSNFQEYISLLADDFQKLEPNIKPKLHKKATKIHWQQIE